MKRFLGIVPPQVTLRGQEARPQPPMGLAYVLNGANRAGWDVAILDACAEGYDNVWENNEIRVTGLSTEETVTRARSYAPDAIGLHLGVSTDHDYAAILAQDLREALPGIPLVMGGSHASLMHLEILGGLPIERIPVDVVVTGRDLASGEASLESLLNAYRYHMPLYNVPGIAYVRDGRAQSTSGDPVTEAKLAELALPRRGLFKTVQIGEDRMDIYSAINRSHTGPADFVPYAVMHTSRGCGGKCTFCHIQYGGFDGTLIGRSLDNIRRELDDLRDRGVQVISIEDDNFGGFSPKRTELAVEILREIAARGFKGVYFPNGVTIKSMINNDHALLRQLRDMADQGMKIRNSLPIESGDSETLSQIIHKPHTLQMVERVLVELETGNYFENPNLELDAFFMVGVTGPDQEGDWLREPMSAIERTFMLARRVAGLGVRVNVWWMKPNPNGPQYKLWRKRFPEKPFYELQFLFPSGIWGSEEEELALDERIREINKEMVELGVGSRRPIYPT